MIDIDKERELFEEYAYRQYFMSNIVKSSGGPFDLQVSAATMDKAHFCERNGKGEYVIDHIDAAWWGWQERAKIETQNPSQAGLPL